MDNLRESSERDFYRDTTSPNLAVAKPFRFSNYPCRPNGRMKIKKKDKSQPTYFFQYLTRPQMDKQKSTIQEELNLSALVDQSIFLAQLFGRYFFKIYILLDQGSYDHVKVWTMPFLAFGQFTHISRHPGA